MIIRPARSQQQNIRTQLGIWMVPGLQRRRPFLKSNGIGKQVEESLSCAGVVGQRKEKCRRQVLQLWLELSRCSGRFANS
jgi:hypothetical protein